MNTSEVLSRAADRVERHGWWSTHCSPKTTYELCAYQAIRNTHMESLIPVDVFARAVGTDHVHNDYAGTARFVIGWNDAPGRTAAEVIAMLRAVAATEKAREARLLPTVIAEPIHA